MKIIDAQVHIWKDATLAPSGVHRKVPTFSAEECLAEMDEAGVQELIGDGIDQRRPAQAIRHGVARRDEGESRDQRIVDIRRQQEPQQVHGDVDEQQRLGDRRDVEDGLPCGRRRVIAHAAA